MELGASLAICLGGATVGVTERLVGAVIRSGVSLDRETLKEVLPKIARVEAPLIDPSEFVRVADSLVGMGPIEELLRDPSITDVLVNGPDEIWVEKWGVLEKTDLRFADAQSVVAAVERVISPLGLRIDRASPMVDARLADGSRLHAVVPPASVDYPIAAIRRFTQAVPDFEALADSGSATKEQANRLEEGVINRRNIVVSGGTGTGKTTLLNLLSGAIPPGQRVVVIEDASELRLRGHVVRMEARPANAEGVGEITLRDLLRSALRLRPDRIVVGEVRGPEALELIQALNTGHAGSMSTVHANSPEEALWRLETLALSGPDRVGEEAVRRQLTASVQMIVQLERRNGHRRVTEIRELNP